MRSSGKINKNEERKCDVEQKDTVNEISKCSVNKVEISEENSR